jgi:signal peptidase I
MTLTPGCTLDQATEPPVTDGDRRTLWRVLILTVPLGLAVLCCLPSGLVFNAHTAPSGSMEPSLPIGSYFVACKLQYGLSRFSFDRFELPIEGRWPDWMPQRGDVVTFKHPKDIATTYVKRVVALPGERIAMKRGRLVIDGVVVPRDLINVENGKTPNVTKYVERLPGTPPHTIFEEQGDDSEFDTTAEVTVPTGHVFVMGDNRDNSVDSRTSIESNGLGPVPLRNIVGKVVFVVPLKTGVALE